MSDHDMLVVRIHDHALRCLTGEASAADQKALDTLVRECPAACRAYVDFICDAQVLRGLAGRQDRAPLRPQPPAAPSLRTRRPAMPAWLTYLFLDMRPENCLQESTGG